MTTSACGRDRKRFPSECIVMESDPEEAPSICNRGLTQPSADTRSVIAHDRGTVPSASQRSIEARYEQGT